MWSKSNGWQRSSQRARLPYEGQLRRLGWHSLHWCRLCGELIAVYMFSGVVELGPRLFFYSASSARLEEPPFQSSAGSLSVPFSIRVVKYWNRQLLLLSPSISSSAECLVKSRNDAPPPRLPTSFAQAPLCYPNP